VRWHVGHRLLTELHLPGRDALPQVPFPNLVLLPQWRTERQLRERLQDFGGAVVLGWALHDMEQSATGVRSVLHNEAGEARVVRSRYLVGCDGAHSRVRTLLGLPMEGHTHTEHFVFGDVEIEGLDPNVAWVWFDADRYLAASPFPGQKAWQVQASAQPRADGTFEPASLELFQRLFTSAPAAATSSSATPPGCRTSSATCEWSVDTAWVESSSPVTPRTFTAQPVAKA
jgi:2-polyprenyl-6-methoxyphenol hydroxylase-like FAD-dependent oxidoreductase